MLDPRAACAAALLLVASCGPAPQPPAPAPAAPSASVAPAGPTAARTLRYSVVTAGRIAGDGESTVGADGSRRSRFRFNDRGRGPDLTTTIALSPEGLPLAVHTSGTNYWKAPVEETLALEGDELRWRSTNEQGRGPRGGFFDPRLGPFDKGALLARALSAAPGKRLRILPAGEAWIEDETVLEVRLDGGAKKLRRVALAGLGYSPELFWLDENGDYFAQVSALTSMIVAGAESLVPVLTAEDQKWSDARAARLATELSQKQPAGGFVITNARVFDSEKRKVKGDQTVVIRGDKIVAVGGAGTPRPEGATAIDAKGGMLLPGLWDMHVHLGDDDGVLDLAMGVTTVRDLGNDTESLTARVARFDAGTEIGPRVLRGGLIDGRGEFSAPGGELAGDEGEARAAVKKYADLGYQQIKIYSSTKPELVPVIAKAAHERGLRVSGHVPQGMNAEQAVKAGYDEVQHANMLFLNFLARPGDDLRGPARFQLVARGAAGFDRGSPQVTAFLALLAAKKTVLDPTLVTFEDMFGADPGDMASDLAPYSGRLPAGIERSARSGGLSAADAQERALFRASHAAMGKLVKQAWDKGIRVVAGTDGSAGLDLSRELELYVAAGIPAPEVLALATLGAARVMGRDKVSGSIAVGKQADLVLIEGDPTRDIGDTRKAALVICRGQAYDPGKLFRAVGMRPRQPLPSIAARSGAGLPSPGKAVRRMAQSGPATPGPRSA